MMIIKNKFLKKEKYQIIMKVIILLKNKKLLIKILKNCLIFKIYIIIV